MLQNLKSTAKQAWNACRGEDGVCEEFPDSLGEESENYNNKNTSPLKI